MTATIAQLDRLTDVVRDYATVPGWTVTHTMRPDGMLALTETDPDGEPTTTLVMPDGNYRLHPEMTVEAEMAAYAAEAALETDAPDLDAVREHLHQAWQADPTLILRLVTGHH